MEKLWTLLSQVHVNPEEKLCYLRLFHHLIEKKKKDKEMTVLTQAVRFVLEQREGLKWNYREEIETCRMSFDYSNSSAIEKIV